jgi:hypothetical protein
MVSDIYIYSFRLELNISILIKIIMKFGAKILDAANITYFTQLIATVSKLCSKTTNKSCILKLTSEKIYFLFTDSLTISPGKEREIGFNIN